MNIKNSKNWSTVPRPVAYMAALLITLAAFLIRSALHPYIQSYAPFQVFSIACLITEYLVGLGPALLSAGLGFMLGTHYFIEPYASFDGISRSDVIVTANFTFVTLFTIVLIEYLRRTLYANQLLLKVSQSRHKISLYRENDRLHLAKKSATATQPIEKLFSEFDSVLLLQLPGNAIYLQPLFYQLCPTAIRGRDTHQWITAVHPEDRPALQKEFALIEGGASRRSLQARMTGPDGSDRICHLVLERLQVGNTRALVLKIADLETLKRCLHRRRLKSKRKINFNLSD